MTTSGRIDFKGSGGNTLAADIFGDSGEPVVFLHGGGQTRRAWDAAAKRVAAAGLTAFTVDLRGHGESDWVADGDYSLDAYAADVHAIMSEVERRTGRRPAAVGASLGGISLMLAAVRHGLPMASLVLVDVAPRMNKDGSARVRGFMTQNLEQGFASLQEASDTIASYLPHRKRPTSLEGLRKNLRLGPDGRYRWHWDPAITRHMRGERAAALVEEVFEGLARVDFPILLVRGARSELVQEEHAREFVERVPGARMVDVEGAGHMVAGDRNDAFANVILDFLVGEKAA